MNLLAPTVVGPISVASSAVEIQSQVPGATVDIFQNGSRVGGGIASYLDQLFDLNPGIKLTAGSSITATRRQGKNVSTSSSPVTVQALGPVGPVTLWSSNIFECASCVALGCMVPGATVDVLVNNVIAGSTVCNSDAVDVVLKIPIKSGSTIAARQTVSGTKGPLTQLPPPDTLPTKLPNPTINPPLMACLDHVIWYYNLVKQKRMVKYIQ